MSLIKAIKAQLGLSNTPANNFVLDASADNGTLKLARGNAGATTQDILTVDAGGKVAFPQNVQTWQDMTASRVLGTTYTNNTGQTISVCVSAITGINATLTLSATVADVMVLISTSSGATTGLFTCTGVFNVPAGATYSVNVYAGTPVLNKWAELR